MFQIITIITLLALIAGIVLVLRSKAISLAGAGQTAQQQSRSVVGSLGKWRSLETSVFVRTLRSFFYLVSLLSFIILALTGFLPIIFGAHVSGLALLLHVTLAPIFAISLTALTLLWAQHHQFNQNDCNRFLAWIRRAETEQLKQSAPELWQKVCFWSVVVFSIPVILSIILSMYPIFGTEGQAFLLSLHGYTSLVVFIAGVMHTYLIVSSNQA